MAAAVVVVVVALASTHLKVRSVRPPLFVGDIHVSSTVVLFTTDVTYGGSFGGSVCVREKVFH